MEKKYELTDETKEIDGHVLHRIKAIRHINWRIDAGDLGGFIENEDCLSHEGTCWVDNDACVFAGSFVSEDAVIYEKAIIKHSEVSGEVSVYDNAVVEYSTIKDCVQIYNNAKISYCIITDRVEIHDDCKVSDVILFDEMHLSDNALINDDNDFIYVKGLGSENRGTTFFKCKDNEIRVNCGCFCGTIDELEEKVKLRHSERVSYREEYLNIARAVRIHFMTIQEYQNSINNPPKKDTTIDKLFKKILKIQ